MTDHRSITNPYEYRTHILDRHSFVGRSDKLEEFNRLFESEYETTGALNNVLISGEKSIGKSSLLHQYKKHLQNSGYFVYEKELAGHVDEYQFIKEIIDKVYTEIAPVEETCLSAQQQEIWFCLTEYFEEHKSTFMDREIRFATIYSKYKDGKKVELDYNVLESDVKRIISALGTVGYRGLVVLVDEFQELSTNRKLLSILRQLGENINNFSIVAAGLPQLISESNFDKFRRTSKIQTLLGLTKSEVVDLITKPLTKTSGMTRYQAFDLFDMQSLLHVVERGGGNPLHITVLCYHMLENYKNDLSLDRIVLNSNVMDRVMEYYSNQSKQSRSIKAALESCTFEDLNNLACIYEYQNVAIRSILTHKNAFNPLSDDILESLKYVFLATFEEVYKLGLFEMVGYDGAIHNLKDLSPAELATIEYRFIGNPLDRLYVKYVYEKITKNILHDNTGLRFEDMLAQKFGDLLYNELLPAKVHISMTAVDGVFKSLRTPSPEEPIPDFSKDVGQLSKIGKVKKLSQKAKEKVMQISEKYQLGIAAHVAHSLGYAGYYSVSAFISVKGKDRYISIMRPAKECHSEFVEGQINDFTKYVTNQFDKYMVEIKSIYFNWVPYTVLHTILFVSRSDDYESVDKYAKDREFDKCAVILDKVVSMNIKKISDQIYCDIDDYNNYGFCAMNAGALDKAKIIFKDCKATHLVSKINSAYLQVCFGQYGEAKKSFKHLIKQIPSDYDCKFLNLAIVHDTIKPKDTVVDEVRARTIVLWNAALLSAYLEESHNVSNSFLKSIKDLSDNEKCINKRVWAWINYYRGSIDNSITLMNDLINSKSLPLYLKQQLPLELAIFQKTLN